MLKLKMRKCEGQCKRNMVKLTLEIKNKPCLICFTREW